MKKVFLILVLLGLLMCVYSIGFSQVVAKVNMPVATGFTVTATRINANNTENYDNDVWDATPSSLDDLNMGDLSELSGTTTGSTGKTLKWIVYLPQYYFAVDIGVTGGALDPNKSFTVSRASETMPLGTTKGLGVKGNIAYCKTVLTNFDLNETADTLLWGVKYRFMDTRTVGAGDISGGWLRLYLGVANGNPSPKYGLPKDAEFSEIFSPGDVGGQYTCSLSITYM